MYTFNRVIKDEKDVSKRRRVVLVEFIDGEKTLERDMQFCIDATDKEIKRAFKLFLKELNFVPTPISDLEEEEEPKVELTAKEKKEAKYQEKRESLKILKEDVELGLATQAQYDTELAAVIAWINK